jgi:hypothetical protein
MIAADFERIMGGSLSAKPIKMFVRSELGIFFDFSLFRSTNPYGETISRICYPKVEYSWLGFVKVTGNIILDKGYQY